MVAKLLPLIPEHRRYVEVFGGGAALLFAKEPSEIEVYNDLDEGLVHFYRTLQREETMWPLLRKLFLSPYARADYDAARATWKDEQDPVERAFKWYKVARWSFGGIFGNSFGTVTSSSTRGMAQTAGGWISTLESFPRFHARIMRVQVEKQDWRTILKRYDSKETFFYLDPPYVPETRKGGSYAHELNEADHVDLVSRLLSVEGCVLLSGYPNPVYEALRTAGWSYREWKTVCSVAGRTRGHTSVRKDDLVRTEAVWFNYGDSGGLGLN
jgi:DNA adenine methylase